MNDALLQVAPFAINLFTVAGALIVAISITSLVLTVRAIRREPIPNTKDLEGTLHRAVVVRERFATSIFGIVIPGCGLFLRAAWNNLQASGTMPIAIFFLVVMVVAAGLMVRGLRQWLVAQVDSVKYEA